MDKVGVVKEGVLVILKPVDMEVSIYDFFFLFFIVIAVNKIISMNPVYYLKEFFFLFCFVSFIQTSLTRCF